MKELEEQDRADAEKLAKAEVVEVSESDSTVIRLVNRIIVDAYRKGASDIHIEPNGTEDRTKVRIRIDGECEDYQDLPPALRRSVVARIKIMANLDISERRKPQDGKIRFYTKKGYIELRVATLPTVNDNEDVVMRILASSKPLPPEAMRYSQRNLVELTRLTSKPYGLFLVVGPTGSGKTTTLHSILGSINAPRRKIWTAEDPVEITQKGLRQVQVQPKIGVTFATTLRSFLRADPDVIMVGEMRDEETASIGVEASLTGHLVFSTLHTNSAPETITRLVDMGLDPFSFADALLGVLAQRLARCLCPKCKDSRVGTEREYNEIRTAYGPDSFDQEIGLKFTPDFRLTYTKGCESCGGTGYKGRLGLHELLVADDELRAAIGRKAPVEELRRLARKGGMTTLLQDGVLKALQGATDMKQVLAVCSR
jgi:type II secretory ATPase GspE/PulE/Tfp pilus assembly ATPase PilB-like protein